MAFWNRIFNKESSVAEAEKAQSSPADPVDPEAAVLQGETGKLPQSPQKKSLFGKFESKVRRKVDSYVDNKADALLDDATKRAEHFRQETLHEVHSQAMQLLDLTEARIDQKLVDIELMLEKRLQAELKMRLRAMLWTLAFVLVMAGVSFAYVWVKRSAGLDNKPATVTEQPEK